MWLKLLGPLEGKRDGRLMRSSYEGRTWGGECTYPVDRPWGQVGMSSSTSFTTS